MKIREYEAPQAMVLLFVCEDIMVNSGENEETGGNFWDGDSTITLPPVPLP